MPGTAVQIFIILIVVPGDVSGFVSFVSIFLVPGIILCHVVFVYVPTIILIVYTSSTRYQVSINSILYQVYYMCSGDQR